MNRRRNRSRSVSSSSSGKTYSSFSSESKQSASNKKSNKKLASISSSSSSLSAPSRNSNGKHDDVTYSASDFSDDSSDNLLGSSDSKRSHTMSLLNLEREYEPIGDGLPFNVYQLMLSIKTSMITVYSLKKLHQESVEKLRADMDENKSELKSEIERLSELVIKELAGVISLSQVIYGDTHEKVALAHINLAQVYLELKHLPKQGKHHCEVAWNILVDNLKDAAKKRMQRAQKEEARRAAEAAIATAKSGKKEKDEEVVVGSRVSVVDEGNMTYIDATDLKHDEEKVKKDENEAIDRKPYSYPDSDKHQMMLNYIYGRSCSILKENEEGESALEKAEQYFDFWLLVLNNKKKLKEKMRNEITQWRQKIYLALAKQYAINGSNGNAMAYYDKCLDILADAKEKSQIDLGIDILIDKARIEQNRQNLETAVDILNDAIKKAEKSELLKNECKLALAQVFSELDDMNSASKAEDLYTDVYNSYRAFYNKKVNEKEIRAKEELVKFYLKQEKYEDASRYLVNILKEKLELYGDFNPKLNATYKMLCSVYLKKSDMPTAAKYLQCSLELEEINFGRTDNRTLSTKETLDNLKKNPNVMTKLKPAGESDKPIFKNVARGSDYIKMDKKLYSKKGEDDEASADESLTKKIAPLSLK